MDDGNDELKEYLSTQLMGIRDDISGCSQCTTSAPVTRLIDAGGLISPHCPRARCIRALGLEKDLVEVLVYIPSHSIVRCRLGQCLDHAVGKRVLLGIVKVLPRRSISTCGAAMRPIWLSPAMSRRTIAGCPSASGRCYVHFSVHPDGFLGPTASTRR